MPHAREQIGDLDRDALLVMERECVHPVPLACAEAELLDVQEDAARPP